MSNTEPEPAQAQATLEFPFAETMARSREIAGPYELHPDVHILASRHRPDIELQRVGHADLAETQNGETYLINKPEEAVGMAEAGRPDATGIRVAEHV